MYTYILSHIEGVDALRNRVGLPNFCDPWDSRPLQRRREEEPQVSVGVGRPGHSVPQPTEGTIIEFARGFAATLCVQ